jgi:hypothetical protein
LDPDAPLTTYNPGSAKNPYAAVATHCYLQISNLRDTVKCKIKWVAEFTIPKAHVISESRNRNDAAKKFPPRHVYKIGCVGLRRLLNGSNARQTPKQHLSDLIDPVVDTEEPEPDIRAPDTIMLDIQYTGI